MGIPCPALWLVPVCASVNANFRPVCRNWQHSLTESLFFQMSIKLVSSDGEEFMVSEPVAMMSEVIKNMV